MQRFRGAVSRRTVPGPKPDELADSRAAFWGRAEDAAGRAAEATLSTVGGYPLTVQTSLIFLEAALAGQLPAGFSTPSKALGRDVIERVPGARLVWRQRPAAS